MLKSKKSELVESFKHEFTEASAMIVAHYHGLSVSQISVLRKQIRQSGAKFSVAKNTLLKLALKDTPFDQVNEMFKGPTAIAISNDPVAVSKVMVEFAEKNANLKIIGGVANDNVITIDGIKVLATLPSIDVLRGKIISILQTPAITIARLLNTPATNVTRVISAKSTIGS